MAFSQELRNTIHNKFIERGALGLLEMEIHLGLQDCTEDERLIMEFFYSTMPASDIGDYDFLLYKKFADFGLFLAEKLQWGREIPEDIFLNFVVHYRINNERIEDCRSFFHSALQKRISGKSMKEAALEVNLWCAEHVTYRDTDKRTASPLTVLKSSYGRCGEESALVVTAMRSVGIPSRQVYVPRWSHCDDNHAWVEVWCDGDWYYLGACEPEPVLNRGWFNNAAARAMLVDGKTFLPVVGEEIITKREETIITNELNRYAPSRRFRVIVKDPLPVPGVMIHFEILNSSEISPIASIITDATGSAALTLGLGSIHIHAVKELRFVEAVVNTERTNCVVMDFSKAKQMENQYQEDFNFIAPKVDLRNIIQLSEEQENLRTQVLKNVDKKRTMYSDGFYQKEKAEGLAIQYRRPQRIKDILKESEGNFKEIYDFLSMDFGTGNKELQLKILESLSKKDYRDVQCSVVAEHFNSALEYQNDYPMEIFVPYILCPRAYLEELTSYRELISSILDKETVESLRKQPKLVWEYVLKFKSGFSSDHEWLTGTPAGIIRSGRSGVTGQKVLFTSICRTIGIPARINPVDQAAQYYEEGEFKNCEENNKADIVNANLILFGGKEKWAYLNNWTISILEEGTFKTLDVTQYPWVNGKLELSLRQGNYRIITSNRILNGDQFARKYCFTLDAGDDKKLTISLRK